MYRILYHNSPHVQPLVLGPEGVDDALSDAVAAALGRAVSTRDKVRRLLERTITCLAGRSPDGRLDLLEPADRAVRRFARHLAEDLGCVLRPASGLRDGSFDVECPATPATTVSLVIARTRRMYQALLGDHEQNPLAVDGWHLAAADRLVERLAAPRRTESGWKSETGNRFRVVDRPWCPPPLDDVRGVAARLIEVARLRGWPPVPLSLLLAMRDDAPRSGDLLPATARDWWNGSRLGRVVRAPVKGSRGERRRDVVLSEEARNLVVAGIEARASADRGLPGMDALESLGTAGNMGALASFPLFPGSGGGSMTHSGFYRTYFRPTVLAEGIEVHSHEGPRPARPHDLRHECIGRQVEAIVRTHPAGPARQAALEELNDRQGWRSFMVPHYAAPILREAAIRKRLDEQRRRNGAVRDDVAWTPRPAAVPAFASAWPQD